jgi:hypothetical protein
MWASPPHSATVPSIGGGGGNRTRVLRPLSRDSPSAAVGGSWELRVRQRPWAPLPDLASPSPLPARGHGQVLLDGAQTRSAGPKPAGRHCLIRQRVRAKARRLFCLPVLLRGSGDHGSLPPPRRPKSKPFTPSFNKTAL